MKFELIVFYLLVGIGLWRKNMDWRSYFFLLLFVVAWVFYNWKKD